MSCKDGSQFGEMGRRGRLTDEEERAIQLLQGGLYRSYYRRFLSLLPRCLFKNLKYTET